MNSEEVETKVRKGVTFQELPSSVKQVRKFRSQIVEWYVIYIWYISFQQLGNSSKEYDKCIVHFSLKNQLRYKGTLGIIASYEYYFEIKCL